MIARELSEFFAGFAPDGGPSVQRAGDPTFLSNVNACYARACWEEIRFRDVAYSEDQAFGSDLLAAGWSKVYAPRRRGPARPRLPAGRVHAPLLRRVPRAARDGRPRRALRAGRLGRAGPQRGRGRPPLDARARHGAERDVRWTARSGVHHAGRKVFSALGSRAPELPRGGPRRPLAGGPGRQRRSGGSGLAAARHHAHPPRALRRGLRGRRAHLGGRRGAAARPGARGWPSASGCAWRW